MNTVRNAPKSKESLDMKELNRKAICTTLGTVNQQSGDWNRMGYHLPRQGEVRMRRLGRVQSAAAHKLTRNQAIEGGGSAPMSRNPRVTASSKKVKLRVMRNGD
jgi:hypothetical protein